MQTYIAKRLLLFIPTLVLITLIIFLILRIVPGDPAAMILAGTDADEDYTQAQLTKVKG